MNKKIAFIGAGNMAEALLSGFLKSRLASKNHITVSDIRVDRLGYLKKKYGISTEKDNLKAVNSADIIFLAVKPQQVGEVLKEVSQGIRTSQLIISIAAGITTNLIEQYLKGSAVIRTMPNTPALAGEGAIAVCAGKKARRNHLELAKKLFSTVGKVVALSEDKMNAVTALSGSGPAYIFYLAEAMEKAGEAMGLSKEISEILSKQTILGAGRLLMTSKLNSSELRRMVTSPGGTTEAAIKHFEEKELLDIIKTALRRAKKRAEELACK